MHPYESIDVLAKPRYVLRGRDIEKVHKLAEVVRRFLHDGAVDYVWSRREVPILEIFMADGTPLTTATSHSSLMDLFKVRRSGKSCKELLTQRLFLVDLKCEFCSQIRG